MNVKQCPNPDCRHRTENGEPAEYRPEFDVCGDCGTTLVWTPTEIPGQGPPQDEPAPFAGKMAAVARCRDVVQLQRVQSALNEAGVPNFTSGSQASNVFGGLLLTRVFVAEELAERARRVLADEELALDAEHTDVASEQRVGEAGEEETRRSGMTPLVLFLILVAYILFRALLSILGK